MEKQDIIEQIKSLKTQKNAVILAHYYTDPDIQDLADYIGDSLGLARQAAETTADIIVFCGVHFMAETAAITSPEKKVLIPAQACGCSLAESITAADIRKWKDANPDGLVVSYVNTTAEVKAETDYCCTSSNAIKVIEHLGKDQKIFFTPDKNLGAYLNKETGSNMELWDGDCCVHEFISSKLVLDMHQQYPEADILIHPESSCSSDDAILNHPSTFFYATSGIIKHAKESNKKQFIIATEKGTLHQLQKENPDKEFILVDPKVICSSMKKVTLKGLYEALLYEQYRVVIDPEISKKARLSISRMLEIG
ncbi:quinolinate synthase NadA [Ancylomarina sp. 16SWW S1-10-2]|uniref:quinolinate synthase NadA n=1 Tax=Ancylomarina sp. 16SWW S1-10-2 TaxID=2499681 RepID=UPI0012AD7C93|nr:quinolinate synthase NadA [Ancylomarina sp. 16SWW S1-10-2]MRT94394.1 quinolinate synthase NadA [Ancylomarina sp. 16SWW S1-10-2]